MKKKYTVKDLYEIAHKIVVEYRKTLEKSGHNASGNLSMQITEVIEYDGRYFEVRFNAPKYWQYLETGTKPHFPPISAIEEWIRVKKIVPMSRNGKIPSTKQLAFAIAKNMEKVGTFSKNGAKATPPEPWRKTLNSSQDILKELRTTIAKMVKQDIDEDVYEVNHTIKNK